MALRWVYFNSHVLKLQFTGSNTHDNEKLLLQPFKHQHTLSCNDYSYGSDDDCFNAA
ncbi:MAG: hypothetical protein POELPBGB_01054 [Bacteroidia bacterium]|nr:hypothetical protein [Bacteroidia bacterium]